MRVRNFARFSKVNFENFAIETIADFFAILHVDLIVSIKKINWRLNVFEYQLFDQKFATYAKQIESSHFWLLISFLLCILIWMYEIEETNWLLKISEHRFLHRFVKTFLKMFSIEFYWNVSTRWTQIEFWIIRKQNRKNISTINSTNLICDIDVDIAENFAESSWLHSTIRIRIHYMLLNRKYRYFETLKLTWQSVLLSKSFWISKFQIWFSISVVFAKKTSKILLIFRRFRKLIQMQKSKKTNWTMRWE